MTSAVPISPTTDKTLNTRLQAADATQPPYHIILGNEAADLDSIVCALALSSINADNKAIPVINTQRAQIHLRRDAMAAFRLAAIETANLRFVDDVPNVLHPRTTITLVDHNTLAASQTALDPHVTAVIDHHVDEHAFPHASPRTIAKVGSCATLVTEHMVDQSPSKSTAAFPPSVSILLLCAILLDCHNMDPQAGKATQRDTAAADMLLTHIGLTQVERNALFTHLLTARTDVTGFTPIDLLHKDVKIIAANSHTVAICTVPVPFDDLLSRASGSLQSHICQFAKQCQADCVVVMLAYAVEGQYFRDLLVLRGAVGDSIVGSLSGSEGRVLLLEKRSDIDGLHAFHQRNTKASRKVVLPIVKKLLLEMPLR